jgi:hypothetical protein
VEGGNKLLANANDMRKYELRAYCILSLLPKFLVFESVRKAKVRLSIGLKVAYLALRAAKVMRRSLNDWVTA